MSTVGVVRYRDKDERSRRVAKQTRNAARVTAVGTIASAKYTRQLANQERLAQLLPAGPPAGWYPDADHVGLVRFWDGTEWTGYTQPTSY